MYFPLEFHFIDPFQILTNKFQQTFPSLENHQDHRTTPFVHPHGRHYSRCIDWRMRARSSHSLSR